MANQTRDIRQMSSEALVEAINAKTVQVIDVRPPFDSAGGRIPGSLSLPNLSIRTRNALLPRDKTLVFISSDGAAAARAAEVATELGFTDVCCLIGGFDAWAAKDLDIETITDGVGLSPLGGR